jgi:hypothetical protein
MTSVPGEVAINHFERRFRSAVVDLVTVLVGVGDPKRELFAIGVLWSPRAGRSHGLSFRRTRAIELAAGPPFGVSTKITKMPMDARPASSGGHAPHETRAEGNYNRENSASSVSVGSGTPQQDVAVAEADRGAIVAALGAKA